MSYPMLLLVVALGVATLGVLVNRFRRASVARAAIAFQTERNRARQLVMIDTLDRIGALVGNPSLSAGELRSATDALIEDTRSYLDAEVAKR